ncbi:MAG: hypothetical protein J07HR59_01264, partial [Halorubrum sp. J07HR59]
MRRVGSRNVLASESGSYDRVDCSILT